MRSARRLLALLCLPPVAMIACHAESAREAIPGGDSGSDPDAAETYSTETINGITVIHNTAPSWGETPPVSLEAVRTIGCGNGPIAFYEPAGIAIGPGGNLLVLDAGNHRIVKIGPQGAVLDTYGEHGQGPGELQRPTGLAAAGDGRVYVADEAIRAVKVLAPTGEELRSLATGTTVGRMVVLSSGELAIAGPELFRGPQTEALIALFDADGNLARGVGKLQLFEDWDAYRYFNRVSIALGERDELFVAYATRNKIEKYDASGNLVLRFDRPLDYEISQKVVQEQRQVGPRTIEIPQVSFVSESIGVDAVGRIWVLSYDRQLRFDERALTIAFADESGNVERTESLKEAERTETDALSFHVFDHRGRFLGRIPVAHHGGPVEIAGDRLYVLEPRHDMCVYEYRIEERRGDSISRGQSG